MKHILHKLVYVVLRILDQQCFNCKVPLFEASLSFVTINILTLTGHRSNGAHHDIEAVKLSNIIDAQADRVEKCQMTSTELKNGKGFSIS